MTPHTLDEARHLDSQDPLRAFRDQFLFPQHQGQPAVYLCGNSLGLQPKSARLSVEQELEDWASLAVEGHFRARRPWMHYHKNLTAALMHIVGARHEHEVVAMNNLTTNLHLMMVSFYRPTAKRFKIVMEGGAFPSDQYAVESQVRFHGYDTAEAIIELKPQAGEISLRTEDIHATLRQHGDSVALVLMGGINYYTGQVFDMASITQVGHEIGALVGWDLAHAAGNVELSLHDWDVDFACWCSYKYLNSGPGATSGVFVHDRWAQDASLPRFAGWWGYCEDTRFLMAPGFQPMTGAPGWQLANHAILSMAAHIAAAELHMQATMPALRAKSVQLTSYLEGLLQTVEQPQVRIITPADRGAQLSLVIEGGKKVFTHLMENGVICDWREPDVIRIAPAPIYNSFEDVWKFVQILKSYSA